MSQSHPALRGRLRAAMLLLCAGLIPVALAAEVTPAAVLSPAVVPAAGKATAELEVADFGRYAIAVTSARGTALQVVDRMTGAGEVAGEAGKEDGRVDLFLDRGAVRVVTYGNKLATGEANLAVTPFRDRHTGAAVQLVEGKPVDDELGDFEQLSWWLEIPQRRRVVFEAAGRNLADLRLWQNGSWLVDAAPEVSVVEPQSGRPLRLCQLAADLAPGLYRLTAYGGPEVAWSKDGVERPFYLRFGWPRDPQTVRERRTVSPFGFDRVLVAGAADFFRLELPESATAGLELVTLDAADPFATGGRWSTISKENVPPVTEIRTAAEPDREIVVTVRATAGQPYVLQHFARTRERELNPRATKAAYWVSTVHAGSVGDAIDPTAILVRHGDGAKRKSAVIAAETVVLTGLTGWARRFNLLDAATIFVKVEQAGTYVLQSRGVAAQFRLEPLFLDGFPEGYEAPPPRNAPAEWQLDPGFYLLSLQPVEGGIAEVELRAKGAPAVALESPRPSVQLGAMTLDARLGYHLHVSQQPGVESGLVVRELPLDLAAALPLALGPGEEIELPVRAAERSRLRALTESGGGLEVSVDGGEWKGNSGNPADAADPSEGFVEKGEHRVRVRSTSATTVLASVGLVSVARLATTPLPQIPAAALAVLPDFPHLSATSSQTLDLAAGESRTFLVTAEAPALYRIESTGLLATSGALRTRTRANLLSQEENGIGRNFALAAYLREGDYQLTVRPRGASAGHLGLELARAPIEEGGNLALGIPARATVDPRRALAFRLAVAEPGHYRFFTWGLRDDFPLRLEDAQGWPVTVALAEGDLAVDLAPGDYRLIVLPQSVPARALILATREVEPRELSGHGPHRLALDQEAGSLWLESEDGAPRDPDLWRFTLPAPTVVAITLSDEMQGELRRRPANGTSESSATQVPPGRGFRDELAAGDYEVAVTSSRQNNRQRYRIAVRLEDLVDGTSRRLSAPGEVTVAVGAESQVEFASYGHQDVRATLMTAVGEPIAASDDRPGDWNFLLSQRLAPGRYRLRVDPVGTENASTLLTMRVLRERTVEPLGAAANAARAVLEVADEAVLVPLTRAPGAEILAVGARAGESLGLALEERQSEGAAGAGSWRALASTSGRRVRLALALAPSTGELRLRIWSLDRRPSAVELSAYAGVLAHRSEADLARGFDLARLPGVEPALAAAVVDLAAPGCFRRAASAEDGPVLMQALAIGTPFEPASPTLAPVGLVLPLAAALDEGFALRVQARRARVGDGEALALALPSRTPITCDVADGGPAVVRLEALGGEPVVGFLDGHGGVGPSTALSVGGGSLALSAKSAGKGRAVELWNAGETAVEARLSGWIAAPLAARSLAWGAVDQAVSARGAVLLELPPGEKELRLTLSAGTAVLALAAGSADTDAEALVWAPLDAATETLVTGSHQLLLLGGQEASGLVSLELLPPSGSAGAETLRPFTDRERFEKRFSSTGAFRLTVAGTAAGSAKRIHVRGASAAVFVGDDGSVGRGSDFDLPAAGGSLRFEHGPGLVSAWIDDEERSQGVGETVRTDLAASWGIDSTVAAQAVSLPATVELAGSDRAFDIEVAAPSLLKLRGTTPLAIALMPAVPGIATGTVRFEVFPEGARLDTVLPAGRTRLVLRGLAGEVLSGGLSLVGEALAPLAEGLGAESLLAAGDSRGYLLRVERPGPVGFGVRADRGGVETVLFNGSGAWIGRGVVQWVELEAGDYALVVTAPPEGRPALVRPALVGTSPPGSGPPPEEARRFLALAAGEAPVVVGVPGAEDLPRDWLEAPTSEGDDSSNESESVDETDEGEATDGDDSSAASDEGE